MAQQINSFSPFYILENVLLQVPDPKALTRPASDRFITTYRSFEKSQVFPKLVIELASYTKEEFGAGYNVQGQTASGGIVASEDKVFITRFGMNVDGYVRIDDEIWQVDDWQGNPVAGGVSGTRALMWFADRVHQTLEFSRETVISTYGVEKFNVGGVSEFFNVGDYLRGFRIAVDITLTSVKEEGFPVGTQPINVINSNLNPTFTIP